MRRREFLGVLGGAAAWPLASRAQQAGMPVVGYLSGASATQFPHLVAAFRRGLNEAGYVEGRNVHVEYRWADGRYDRVSALAADLLGRGAAVLVATQGTPTAQAVKAATSTVPIVFAIGGDPVMFGLVESLNRPGGNVTGVTLIGQETVTKRLEVLLELIPGASAFGVLANLQNPMNRPQLAELQKAAQALGKRHEVFRASTDNEIDAAFVAIAHQRLPVLVVASDPFFDDRRKQIVALAARYGLPASYTRREFVVDGGLVSYSTDIPDSFRHAGLYTGRILKGERPANLPVLWPTKFEITLNLKTAKALGITVPPTLLGRADEVIE